MAKIADACIECEPESVRKTAASKIFEAARELFYRRGVRAVGVDEIVCEAGVTKPSLYRAFKSKDELVAACLRESAREGFEEINALLAAAGDDPHHKLRALIRHYANKTHDPAFRGCLISNVAVELPEPDHPGRDVLKACKTALHDRLVELSRAIGAAEPEILADGLMLVIEGTIGSHHIFGCTGPTRSIEMTCETLIESHLRRQELSVDTARVALPG
jgi:AcrR family transcriptional regulator